MPRKKTRRKKPEEGYSYIIIVVHQVEAETEMRVNSDVYDPRYAWFSSEDDPLFEASNHIRICGACSHPDERKGDLFHLTLYSDESLARDLNATLKDAQVREKYGAPKYRTYRGRDIPVYDAPKGIAVLNKVRGKPEWSAWIKVKPRMVADVLLLSGQHKQLYLTLHEWKFERKRWIRSVGVQTTDPAQE